jgi:hypothetical protein
MITLGDLRKLDLPDDTVIALGGVFRDDYARSLATARVVEEEFCATGFDSSTGEAQKVKISSIERKIVSLSKSQR